MPEPERELTAGELFDGNISRLGRVEHDLPFDGNGKLTVQGCYSGNLVTRRNVTPLSLRDLREFNWIG
jgi:hypothetical protein